MNEEKKENILETNKNIITVNFWADFKPTSFELNKLY
jgi:hypothetical protein